jgi:hypothetical protein
MKLKEFLAIHGTRATAEKLVNLRIQYVTGLNIDLPNKKEFWDIIEDIEEELKEEDCCAQKIKESLQIITPNYNLK